MKLTITKRSSTTKSAPKQIRRAGSIPAILYGKGIENQKVQLQKAQFEEVLRSLPAGHLSTHQFDLSLDGVSMKALVKHISYHPVTYAIEHIDFMILSDTHPVSIKVPIELVGIADCPGIKLGGILRQVIRSISVSCYPRDIPSVFQFDVRDLDLGGAKRLSDLAIPENVRPLARMNEVAVVIAKAKTA